MKNPVLKNNYGHGPIPSPFELREYMGKHNLSFPVVVPVAFRVGKRKKLKSVRFLSLVEHPCESCGFHRYLSYVLGGQTVSTEVF